VVLVHAEVGALQLSDARQVVTQGEIWAMQDPPAGQQESSP
jgi:hypothetical protein